MKDIKQSLLVIGSVVALIIAALASYFVLAYPSITSVLLFVIVVPVLSMLGLGFFKIAREEFLPKKGRS
jgi:uncharacterized protein YacL